MSIQTNNVLQAQADKEFRLAMEQETQRQADEKAQLEKDRTAATLSNKDACELLLAQGIAHKEYLKKLGEISDKIKFSNSRDEIKELNNLKTICYNEYNAKFLEDFKKLLALVPFSFHKLDFLRLAQEYTAKCEAAQEAEILSNKDACDLLVKQALAHKELLVNISAICEKMNSGVDAETWADLYATRDNIFYSWEREHGEACETFNKLVSCKFDKEEFLTLAQQYLAKREAENYKESTMKPVVFFELPQPLTAPETISDAQLINFFEVAHKLDYYGSLRFSCAFGKYCINIQMRNNFVWRVSFSNNTEPAKSTLVDCGVLQNLTKISAYRQAYTAFYRHQKSLI